MILMERLLHAYHTEGLNVAEPQTLERLGNEAGLDRTDVHTMLGGECRAPQPGVRRPEHARRSRHRWTVRIYLGLSVLGSVAGRFGFCSTFHSASSTTT
ncbi:hypothetical protein GCM10022225_56440 [Plantactinospora mayteni]